MPGLLAHCIYGDKITLNSSSDYLNGIIRRNQQAFHIGCQGPDLFLFYHRLPIYTSKEPFFKYGCLLHAEKINELFESLLKQAKEKTDEILIAYVAGFFCHHCLDSTVHPYVYYRTEHIAKNEHIRFETQMEHDILCANKLTAKDYISYQLINSTQKIRDTISEALVKMIKELYNEEYNPDQIAAIFGEMVMIEKILYNPDGKKYKLIEKLEKMFKCQGLGTNMIIPTTFNDRWDVLNNRRQTWYNPTDEKTPQNADFQQLGQQAIEKGTKLFDKIDDFLHNRNSLKAVTDLIDGRDYEMNRLPGTKRIIFKEAKQ